MRTDLKDKRSAQKCRLMRAFSYALSGVKHVIVTEKNMQIHLFIASIVILAGWFFSLTSYEWLFVAIAIGGVLVLELMNSAIERVVDLITSEYHPLAKQAKDAAAGAVFLYACLAVIIGLIIFLPKCCELIFQ